MKKTVYQQYNLPERDDRVNVGDLNQSTIMIDTDIAKLQADVATKAPIHSPKFSGEPLAPKPGIIDEYERIATVGSISDALEVEVL